ncbi:MAG: squalene/phytoene synthase family protein [Alphaproteobacteria bacterium]
MRNGKSAIKETPADLAEAVTRNSASTLWFVGRFLSEPKRRLFEASYATMRVIDDFVDDDFLNRPEKERRNGRADAENFIRGWRDQADAALNQRGRLSPNHPHAPLFTALADAANGGDLPVAPWQALARAMLSDVREELLVDWDDFYAYCDGATVAPASVFLHVLQAHDNDGLKAGLSGDELAQQARDMALFCYLTHIRRDFAKDVARGGQLVTLPQQLLSRHGLARNDLGATPDSGLPVLFELGHRAEVHRATARKVADDLLPDLGLRERTVLDTLLSLYEAMHHNLSETPLPEPTVVSRWTETLRTKALSALGAIGP